MKIATITEAKNKLSALIDVVKAGETIVIVDRGIPVARLEPATLTGDTDGRLARLQRAGVVRAAGERKPRRGAKTSPVRLPRGVSVLDALLRERREGR